MYTNIYLNQKNIKYKPQLLPGAENHLSAKALVTLILICNISQPCSAEVVLENCCKATLTDEYAERICSVLGVTPRTLRRILNELTDANMLHIIGKKPMRCYVNPFVLTNGGSAEMIQAARAYFADKGIFYPLELDENIRNGYADPADEDTNGKLLQLLSEDPSRQYYFSLYLSIENILNYRAFVSDSVNYTELTVFLLLANKATFTKMPYKPESCNRVILDGKEKKRLANTLGIGVSTLNRVLADLCGCRFFHKIEGVVGQYMINPYISAKGNYDRISTLRSRIMDGYFSGCADGDTLTKTEDGTTVIVDKLSGELLRVYSLTECRVKVTV